MKERRIMENKVVEWILKYQLVAISRGVKPELMVKTAKALYDGGVRSLEITFNQASDTCIQDTETSIKQVKQALGDKMCIGAGTVMTIEQAEAAYQAGADFALAPDTNIDVIKKIVKLGMAAVPGALTPTEIAAAYQAGASIVKLFPAGNMGLNYIKAIRGPINHVPLMAVGGVNVENIREFLDNGFTSVGIGSNIVKNSLIEAGKFDEITALAKAYTEQLEK